MSASRSPQAIFILYPALSDATSRRDFIPHPASRQTYVGASIRDRTNQYDR